MGNGQTNSFQLLVIKMVDAIVFVYAEDFVSMNNLKNYDSNSRISRAHLIGLVLLVLMWSQIVSGPKT